MQKDTPFTWGDPQQNAFNKLKESFSTTPILIHFDPNNPIVIETDASNYVIAAILSQISPKDGDIHPISFYSLGIQPPELNYEIYDKELLTIYKAFKQWQNYLEGASHVILVLSDHKNFATSKQLTWRQVQWLEYLSSFHYIICYRVGRLRTKPNVLTCRGC